MKDNRIKKESHTTLLMCFAESEGFKPPIPVMGIPDFESSAFDHSANSPIAVQIYEEVL